MKLASIIKISNNIGLIILVILLFISCSKEKEYEGDSIKNYPDMEKIFKENLEPFQKRPHTFKLVRIENGKKDSSFLKAADVKWEELKSPFLKANLHKNELDKHYKINVFTDTLYSKMTMLLTAIDKNEITSKMSVTMKAADNSIQTVYAEARDAGIFTTKEYKLLFVDRKTLQVQETTKYPFSDDNLKIQTLTFMN
jgi:hypothetical protein